MTMLHKLTILCLLFSLVVSLMVMPTEPAFAQHPTPTAEPGKSGSGKNNGKPEKPKPKPGPRDEGEDN
ncbi:MAG TPA: hypothetical protein VNA16_06005 [Abditibacteriaceae bacterium]|nr:hypothetical protein [Abditibacteriaceae bacterium]